MLLKSEIKLKDMLFNGHFISESLCLKENKPGSGHVGFCDGQKWR
jgi:hypothetical protein